MTTIAVVSRGLSEPSSTPPARDRLAASAVTAVSADQPGGTVDVRHVELRPIAHEIVDAMLTAVRRTGPGRRSAHRARGRRARLRHPGLHRGDERSGEVVPRRARQGRRDRLPVLLAATGGTARHSLAIDHALRPVFAYLRAAVVPTGVFAATDDWGSEADSAALDARIRRAGVGPGLGDPRLPADAAAGDARRAPTDFASLLGGLGH